jgi:hypothetical protein
LRPPQTVGALALGAVLAAAPAHPQVGAPFVAGCTPSFGDADTHPIDADCGIEGAATTDAKRTIASCDPREDSKWIAFTTSLNDQVEEEDDDDG